MVISEQLLSYLTPAELEHFLAWGRPEPPLPFADWLTTAHPKFRWDYPHFAYMRAALDDVTAGREKRAYFSVPIRHGKSLHNTVSYAAYRIVTNPSLRVLLASYNQRQAEKFSRQTRKLVSGGLSREKDGAGEWETTAGGGLKAVGAGAGLASVNADLILVDDPIGSREDAESETVRERTWDWLTNDVLARCEPHTAVVLTGSRWHQDDPGGRILDGRAGKWRVVDLPAEAEENDPLGRKPGEPLWPELRGPEWLAEKKAELGAYGFAGLLQGRPRPRAGGMFKWDWWVLLPAAPIAFPLIRYWDVAGTDADGSNDPDYTVGALVGRMADKRTAVLDIERFRYSVGRRDAEMEEVAKRDKVKYDGRCVWWLEEEVGIDGEKRTASLVRRLQAVGIAVRTERAGKKKELRAEPLASACEVGNVCLAPGNWRDSLRREAADFPAGRHDDMVDAVSGGFNRLAEQGDVAAVEPVSLPPSNPEQAARSRGYYGVS